MIVIGLGGNLTSPIGPPEITIPASLKELARHGIGIVATSSLYATRAWPDPRDPAFINAVAHIETGLPPEQLMLVFQTVEAEFGRVRNRANAPRTLDLDLLDYDGQVRNANPILPHPRMETRGFVLVPLAEIAPRWISPASGKSVRELIAALPEAERHPVRLAPASTSP
ncbi:MAG: 2-amino-4-hydroxy-6-hydroxymethyldihydropteridine diphosphokinase [Rhizomicrobium sp.]|jgi:2-amino-4-hydroxy-6-hydroxymethyldihydropteridine diphosphokinase